MLDHIHLILLICAQIYTIYLFRLILFNNIYPFICAFILIFICASPLVAQKTTYTLTFKSVPVQEIAQSNKLQFVYKDSTQLKRSLQHFIYELQHDGYLEANLDTLTYARHDFTFTAHIHLGNLYSAVQILNGNIPDKHWKKLVNQAVLPSIKKWSSIRNALLGIYENSGYPFAAIMLDSIVIRQQQFHAQARITTGPLISFDSLVISGDVRLNKSFLAHQIGWTIGKPYGEQQAQAAIQRIAQLNYLNLKSPPQVLFQYDRAYLKLELLPQKNTQLDGILGILLNNQDNTGRRPIITGMVDLKLQNPFGKGKTIQFAFQRLRLGAQLFDFTYQHPDLLKSNLSFQANFYSLREDSLFNNLRRSIALIHHAAWGNLGFQAGIIDSRLTFSNQQRTADNLQNFGSNKVSTYGIHYHFQQLDHPKSPKKGIAIDIKTILGNKTIRPSLAISDSRYESIYGAIALKSLQFSTQISLTKYWPLGQTSSLYSRLASARVFNQKLYQNDLFRVGGINTLRGFNENAFFTSFYNVLSLEYRIYLSNDSYFFTFLDQAYLENDVDDFRFQDYPTGLGLGMAISTKSGLFRFIYSLGNAQDQPIGFRQAKIHFGLTSLL